MFPSNTTRRNIIPFSKLDTSSSNKPDLPLISAHDNPSSPEELDVVIGFLPFDFPMAPTSQSVGSKRKLKKIPSPIDIASCSASPNLPPASAPMPRNAGWNPHVDQRGYTPSSPINRSASVPLSAGHVTARYSPSTAAAPRTSRDMGISRATRTALAQSRNVRFDVLNSPKYSHLRLPACCGSMSLHSPDPYSPKTPMDMCFEDPDVVPDSPISDEPMISIAPISDTLDTIQEEDSKENRPLSLPMCGRYEEDKKDNRPSSLPSRARQVDRETLMRLTGEIPSAIDLDDDSCPRLCWQPDVEETLVLKTPIASPRLKGYVPRTYMTDRQSILGAYFHRGDY